MLRSKDLFKVGFYIMLGVACCGAVRDYVVGLWLGIRIVYRQEYGVDLLGTPEGRFIAAAPLGVAIVYGAIVGTKMAYQAARKKIQDDDVADAAVLSARAFYMNALTQYRTSRTDGDKTLAIHAGRLMFVAEKGRDILPHEYSALLSEIEGK